ncbi:MAG: HD domain-containing protein [Nannocystaceae bacterium]|nr:HD domain-containing protein [Myxococcales bacterium]
MSAAAARAFAIAAHGDQRYGARPYATHLDAVAALVDGDEALQVIAYLHDVVEDTAVTLAEVEARFGADVARCVALLTDPPLPTRRARKRAAYAALAQVDAAAPEARALVVKVADRLANVRSCVADENPGLLAMYRREHAAFRAAARREGVAAALWAELDALLS